MNYLNNHEIGQERVQQFVKNADEMRHARKMAGEKSERGFMNQLRDAVMRTLSAIIR